MDKSKIITIFEYNFHRKTTAVETVYDVNNGFREDSTNKFTGF